MLTTDADVPVVTETTVDTVALHALEIVTEAGIDHGGDVLEGLAGVAVLLTVEEVGGDVEVLGALDDSKDGSNLGLVNLTGAVKRERDSEYKKSLKRSIYPTGGSV